jgi:hypothetical protein
MKAMQATLPAAVYWAQPGLGHRAAQLNFTPRHDTR